MGTKIRDHQRLILVCSDTFVIGQPRTRPTKCQVTIGNRREQRDEWADHGVAEREGRPCPEQHLFPVGKERVNVEVHMAHEVDVAGILAAEKLMVPPHVLGKVGRSDRRVGTGPATQ